jgi:hypothetical protein
MILTWLNLNILILINEKTNEKDAFIQPVPELPPHRKHACVRLQDDSNKFSCSSHKVFNFTNSRSSSSGITKKSDRYIATLSEKFGDNN